MGDAVVKKRRRIKENKTAALPIRMKPSDKKAFEKAAYMNGVSMNEAVNTFILKYIRKHRDKIVQYDKESSQ